MNELQTKVLGLLKEIDTLCRENDVEYYLTAGSLIGAVRHKGFIPWDDDADIIMTRDNWEKFYDAAQENLPPNRAFNIPADTAATTISHYVDISTMDIRRYHVTAPEKTGVVIDIIIADPIPDEKSAKDNYVTAITTHSELTLLPYHYSMRIGQPTHFKWYWTLGRIWGLKKVLEHIDKKTIYREEDSDLYVQRFVGSPHFWPKEYFGKPKYVPFEDTMLPIPARAEDCLCIGYDDEWMYVPRGGNTKSTHEFSVHSLTLPGEWITADFEAHVDRKKLMRTYVNRKKRMVAQTKNKFKVTMDSDKFLSAYVQMIYEQKLKETDIAALLRERDFETLDTFFDQYQTSQCNSHFLGSSALEGWLNWYRKCNPLLIDIGDEALYVFLCLLMHKQKLAWTGKLLKARKAINRPLTEQLEEMDGLYCAIKSATSAYDCHEDEICGSILQQWGPRHPENAFLWKLDLKEQIRRGLCGQALFDRTEQGLLQFPDDPELLYLQAEALLELGQTSAALDIFRALAQTTNHGIVLLHMRERIEVLIAQDPQNKILYEIMLDIRRQSGEEDLPSLEELFPEAPEASGSNEDAIEELPKDDDAGFAEAPVNHALSIVSASSQLQEVQPLNAIQAKRLQLLTEVAQICRENKIRYFLIGKGLLQAVRGGRYIDPHGELVIAMTPPNCAKFVQAVKDIGRLDRYLDSMDVNPRFPRFCVRYCDSESLDFSVSLSGCSDRFGIYITIEILRNPSKLKSINLLDQMLEGGWESTLNMKWTSFKRLVSRSVVSLMCLVLGRKRVGKLLYRRFLAGPKAKRAGTYYLKPFWGKRTYYPAYLFRFSRGIRLEGQIFNTIKLYPEYLKRVFGPRWKTRNMPLTKKPQFTRIVDPDIPSQKYMEYLQSKQIDRMAFWRLWYRTGKKYAPVVTLGTDTGHYWDIMCLCGDRYRLWEKYIPMRLYLIELYRSNRVKELSDVLKDYRDTAIKYSKKILGICFDKRIFELMEYCLYAYGNVKQAQRLRRLVPEQDWQPIVRTGITNDSTGGTGMRAATQDDVPAILVYLKRHVSDCLYMYIDIAKYGLENPYMKVWLDSDERGIKLVVMKYHTGISVYTDTEDWDISKVAQLIKEENVSSVTGPKDTVNQLYELCGDEYKVTYGSVFSFTKHRDFDFSRIETATVDDALEIAELIVQDEGIGSYYDVRDLATQLAERMNTNMGRSYVIRSEGKIVAHIASYAEFEGLATTGGLIVSPECRTGVYGGALESYLVRNLLEENFVVYTFVTERLRSKLLLALGNQCVGEYGKMYIPAVGKDAPESK